MATLLVTTNSRSLWVDDYLSRELVAKKETVFDFDSSNEFKLHSLAGWIIKWDFIVILNWIDKDWKFSSIKLKDDFIKISVKIHFDINWKIDSIYNFNIEVCV